MADEKENKTGYLEESPGQQSSMRLNVFITVLVVVGIWLAWNIASMVKAFKTGCTFAMVDFTPYALAALISALTLKAGQKAIENIEKVFEIIQKFKSK
jgi:hypothetical protein